jgi:hypothetical protein
MSCRTTHSAIYTNVTESFTHLLDEDNGFKSDATANSYYRHDKSTGNIYDPKTRSSFKSLYMFVSLY